MSEAGSTRFGVYQSHSSKGTHGEILVTIAFPPDVGLAFLDDLGPSPARYKKIAVAVGAVADTLLDLLRTGDPVRPEPGDASTGFEFGKAVAEVARLVCEVDRLLLEMAADPTSPKAAQISQQRITTARKLAAAQDELTAYFRASVPGGRAA